MRVCQGEGEGGLTLCMGAMGRFPLSPPYIICCPFCLYSPLRSQPHELYRYAGFQKSCLSRPPQEKRYAGSQDVDFFLYISPSLQILPPFKDTPVPYRLCPTYISPPKLTSVQWILRVLFFCKPIH